MSLIKFQFLRIMYFICVSVKRKWYASHVFACQFACHMANFAFHAFRAYRPCLYFFWLLNHWKVCCVNSGLHIYIICTRAPHLSYYNDITIGPFWDLWEKWMAVVFLTYYRNLKKHIYGICNRKWWIMSEKRKENTSMK